MANVIPQSPNRIGGNIFTILTNSEDAITAFAGGGQTSAYQLAAQISRLTTVATAADSAKLPKISAQSNVPGAIGFVCVVHNLGASAAQLFGYASDTINGIATATGVSVPAGFVAYCVPSKYTSSTDVGDWTVTIAAYNQSYTSITVNDITGGDSSLDITGIAAAQGGDVVAKGGTSSTTGNAGGVAKLQGGTPGLTGVGGAATVVAAAGGATSGAGGVGSVTGGAGTAGNAAGGVGKTVGGAGQGSAAGGDAQVTGGAGGATGAGGAITITSGAGGATSGAAGAIAISVGSATSGNGSAVTITAGNGAASTNSGGNVNLVGGTAVSTGVPGEVQVNGDANLIPINVALTATDATRTVFVATRACRLKAVKEVHSTASSSGTLQLEKCTGTTAPGSGTSLLTGTMSLAGTANTVVSGTPSSTVATITLAAGDRISIVIGGTMTNLVGGLVTITLAPC